MKKICFLYMLLLLTFLCGCGRREQLPRSARTSAAEPEPAMTGEATYEPMAFTQPCVESPYDYYYEDDSRRIAVKRYTRDGVSFLAADVQLMDASLFHVALSDGKLEPLSDMAERSGAVLAINADDYGVHDYGVIIRNGQLLRANETTRHLLSVDSAGDFDVITRQDDPASLAQELLANGTRQSFEFGPELIRDGKAVEFDSAFDLISTAQMRREPRTAIGQIGQLHYVIIVADGRQPCYSRGMTLAELQDCFISFGAKTAINLDGGGSTEMWFRGDIINLPSEGKERKLSDIIYF